MAGVPDGDVVFLQTRVPLMNAIDWEYNETENSGTYLTHVYKRMCGYQIIVYLQINVKI